MDKDTINYYLFFNCEGKILVFKDINTNELIYPQKEEKTLNYTYETLIEKMMMVDKSKQSNNDVLIFKENNNIITKRTPFMKKIFDIISLEDLEFIDTYNGEYKLIEYSDKRYFLIVKYLLCNYYAKYIELSKSQLFNIMSLCDTYGYEPDFVTIDDLYNFEDNNFTLSKRYLQKLDKSMKIIDK